MTTRSNAALELAPPDAASTAVAAIEAHDPTKTYKDVRALDGLSFAARTGTVFALLGPNGAGESSAVKLLTLARPDIGLGVGRRPRPHVGAAVRGAS
jgi:ABC-type polysaccharide/polyol phosphate transport system ATPase subunit